MNDRIRGFDGLRALAVLLVFLHHKAMAEGSGLGHLGVWIFFALSGFLITDILTSQRRYIDAGTSSFAAELKRFLYRRTLRIFPIYYLLLATLALMIAIGFAGHDVLAGVPFHFAYLSNFWIADVLHHWPGRYSHLWSLSIEEQFYLVFAPLLLAVRAKWHVPICCALCMMGIAALIGMKAVHAPAIVIYTHPLTNFWLLALGGIGGALLRRGAAFRRCVKPLPIALALVICVAMLCSVEPAWEVIASPLRFTALYVLYGASITALVCSIASGESAALIRVLEWAPLAALGRISYGFYLYHGFIPNFTKSNRIIAMFGASGIPWWAHALSAIASFVLTLTLAKLSWRFIEEPILRLKNRRFTRKTESSEASPSALSR